MAGRFRFSMPRRRSMSDPWFRVGSIEVTTTVLVTALCVVSILIWTASKSVFLDLVLLPDDVKSGQVWRLLSWPIANDLAGNDAIWKAISVALFWYFAREIENQLGRAKFTWMLVLMAVIAGLAATGLGVGLAYIRTVELALFLVFVLENPRRPFFFGIPAWAVALVIIGIDVLQLIANRDSETLIVYAITMITAVWTARSMGMLVDQQWLPQIKLPHRRRSAKSGGRSGAGGGGPVVVEGPWPTTPTYRPMQDQAEVDQILDKIALVGMDGLTADEKKRLNEASKRLRKQGY